LGEISKPELRLRGAVIGLAQELRKNTPDINLLCLLIMQYLCAIKVPSSVSAQKPVTLLDYLQVYGPIPLRPYIRILQQARNTVAHSMYTQLYDAKVRKHADIIIHCGQCILDYEISMCESVPSEASIQKARLFWGMETFPKTL